MPQAIIYQPAKSATQSGLKGTRKWLLVYSIMQPQTADHLMGWVGGANTQNQLRLKFDTRQQAVAYAEAKGLSYEVKMPHERIPKQKSYANNFM